jgi:hypothetical protein
LQTHSFPTRRSSDLFPDGAINAVAMPIPTPRAANVLPNTPPLLAPIPDQEVTLGQTLVFSASASDTDVPQQTLCFSLGAGAPLGATINSVSGEFRWTPASGPGTNAVSVVVSDNGVPSLSATQTFRVTVWLPPTLGVQVSGTQLQLSWPRGTLQQADAVTGPYHDVTDQSPLTVDLAEAATQFYRLRL